MFLARFCFLSEEGQFEYKIEYSEEYQVQNLLLYYDTEVQWPSVYKTLKTCKEKESVLMTGQNQIINLTEDVLSSGCLLLIERVRDVKRSVISCHSQRRFHSARPRWWFLAISNCNSVKGLNMRYQLWLTNGVPGDLWRHHFSADEFYVLPLLLIFFIIYTLVVLATVACSVELKNRQLLHTTYKLFNISVLLQEVGIIFLGVAYIRYALDGVGFPAVKMLGRLCEAASEILFTILLLLMAKGYTITRGRLRFLSSLKLMLFMGLYIMTTLILFAYEQHRFDPGEVLYLYESPPGYGLIILRIVAWWMFMYSIIFTLKRFPRKSDFYHAFNMMGTLWFVSGPCFVIVANNLIDKWIRESIVYAVQHFIALAGHVLFLLLTLPNQANKNFPFHVRTSQIDVVPFNQSQIFGSHAYEPCTPISTIDSTLPTSYNLFEIKRLDIPNDEKNEVTTHVEYENSIHSVSTTTTQ